MSFLIDILVCARIFCSSAQRFFKICLSSDKGLDDTTPCDHHYLRRRDLPAVGHGRGTSAAYRGSHLNERINKRIIHLLVGDVFFSFKENFTCEVLLFAKIVKLAQCL